MQDANPANEIKLEIAENSVNWRLKLDEVYSLVIRLYREDHLFRFQKDVYSSLYWRSIDIQLLQTNTEGNAILGENSDFHLQ
jgi:hypothetical protein